MSAWKWDCIPSNCYCLGWHPMQPQLLVQPFQQQFFARFSRASSWWAPHILHEKALASWWWCHTTNSCSLGCCFWKFSQFVLGTLKNYINKPITNQIHKGNHSLPSLCSRHPFCQIRNCSDRCVGWSSLQVGSLIPKSSSPHFMNCISTSNTIWSSIAIIKHGRQFTMFLADPMKTSIDREL